MTWKPPQDEVVDSGWKPPEDEAISAPQESNYTEVSPLVQKTADEFNVPARVGRGVGVAIGKTSEATGLSPLNMFPSSPVTPDQIQELIHAAKNPEDMLKKIAEAAHRGYEAMKPGFKPTKDEESYANIGEIAGNTAALVPAAAAIAPLGVAGQLAADTALAGGSTALTQAQKGKVKVLPSVSDELSSIKEFLSAPGIKTGLNILPDSIVGNAAIPGVSKAIPSAVEAVQNGIKAVSIKMLPGIFKGTAGIPQQATEMALKDPEILKNLQGTQESVANKVNNVIDAVQEAKLQTGNVIGKVFKKYAGMDSPVDDILAAEPKSKPIYQNVRYSTEQVSQEPLKNPVTVRFIDGDTGEILSEKTANFNHELPNPETVRGTGNVRHAIGTQDIIQPSRSFEDVKADWKAAKDGSLFRTPNMAGGSDGLSDTEKLAVLTKLKREANQYATYFKQVGFNGSGAAPIDSSMSTAAKKIANDISNSSGTGIRDVLPNGKKLMVADDAWSGIHEIYNTLQKDLSDSGKAQDAIMKLVKGDITWLTGGRMAQKVAAIRRIEQITGSKVLAPAMKEMTAAIFKQNYGKGLAPIVGAGELGSMLALAGTGHPGAAVSLLPMVAAGSPRIVGGGIRAAQTAGKGIQEAANSMDLRRLFNELLAKR